MTSNSENEFALDEVIQQLNVGTSMPAELMEIFSEEADDHLRTIYDRLNCLQGDKADMSALADVRRASHTLKGAAGAVGLQSATRLAHRMEDLLDQLAERKAPITESQLKLLLATADQLQGLTTGDFDVETVAQQIVELYQSYSHEMAQLEQPASPQPAANKKPVTLTAPSTSAQAGQVQPKKNRNLPCRQRGYPVRARADGSAQ